MKDFFQSIKAFAKATVNYLKSMWIGALEVLSMRAVPQGELDERMKKQTFAQIGEKQRKRTFFGGPYGWRMLNRRLERGRSAPHRPEWRAGKN
jgi:hypothetical protein